MTASLFSINCIVMKRMLTKVIHQRVILAEKQFSYPTGFSVLLWDTIRESLFEKNCLCLISNYTNLHLVAKLWAVSSNRETSTRHEWKFIWTLSLNNFLQ